MNIKYCGPALDYSGYGEANRHDIAALASAQIGVTVELTRHCLEISEFGVLGELVRDMSGRDLEYDIKILHTTPNIYHKFIEPQKYHIGRVFWETDKLPPDFAEGCKLVDEIWTGSEYNAQAIRNAGIDKPIYIIPEAVDVNIGDAPKYVVPIEESFRFYSVFEWTERKNPRALIEAYWREFENDQSVALVLKTYIDNFTRDKRLFIDEQLAQMKRRVPLKKYAPVYLFRQLVARSQIYAFHKAFQCFVSTHRGEGWGIPQMEAMLVGNPVISTNCGGIHEYLENGVSAFLLPYTSIPLQENTRNSQWYCKDQKWADVSVDDVRQAMRQAYDHWDQAKKIGENGRSIVHNQFEISVVGKKMRERLEQIKITA